MLRTPDSRKNCATLRSFTTLSWAYSEGVYSAYTTRELGEKVMSALNGQDIVSGCEPAGDGRFKLTISADEAVNIPSIDMSKKVQARS